MIQTKQNKEKRKEFNNELVFEKKKINRRRFLQRYFRNLFQIKCRKSQKEMNLRVLFMCISLYSLAAYK